MLEIEYSTCLGSMLGIVVDRAGRYSLDTWTRGMGGIGCLFPGFGKGGGGKGKGVSVSECE